MKRACCSGNPNILILNTDLLRRLGVTSRRLQQPALLQGLYWCRVWRYRPLRSLTSRTVYVRFQGRHARAARHYFSALITLLPSVETLLFFLENTASLQ